MRSSKGRFARPRKGRQLAFPQALLARAAGKSVLICADISRFVIAYNSLRSNGLRLAHEGRDRRLHNYYLTSTSMKRGVAR